MLAAMAHLGVSLAQSWSASRRLAASLACAVAALHVCTASAQVLEIGDGGQVQVYDRPSVFDGEAAHPIARPDPHPVFSARTNPAVRPNPAARPELASAFRRAGSAVDLSPALLSAVASQESRFRPAAISRAGAIGVMQLMPGTARDLGCDPFDLTQNVAGGARYLRAMMDAFQGDLPLALAAYNAGPAAVRRYGGVPPYAETRAYVDAILRNLSALAIAEGQDGVSSHDASSLRF